MDSNGGGSLAKAMREWTQFVILLFATVWGVYTFVYKETIVPAMRPAALAVTGSMEEVGRTADSILVRVRIYAVNRTERKIYVPALWYSAWGVRFKSQKGILADFQSQVGRASLSMMSSRYSVVDLREIVAVGAVHSTPDTFYEPTDETTNEILFKLPINVYDAIELQVRFFFTKDTTDLAVPAWNPNELGELVPELTLMGRPFDRNDAEHLAWEHANGLGENSVIATLSLWPPSESAHVSVTAP